MIATFYKNLSDSRKVEKNLTAIHESQNVKLLDDTNILNLKISVSRQLFDESLSEKNYIYISKLSRYYFLSVPKFVGNFVEFDCNIDVLETYKDYLKSLTCTIARNENLKNGYLHDDRYSVYAYEQIVCKMFPNSMNNDSIILMTVG